MGAGADMVAGPPGVPLPPAGTDGSGVEVARDFGACEEGASGESDEWGGVKGSSLSTALAGSLPVMVGIEGKDS